MLAPVFLAPVVLAAKGSQVDMQALLRGLDFEEADLAEPGAMISREAALTVVRRALKLLPLANHGLELGKHARVTERGNLAIGMLAARTLGEAISLEVQFPRSAGHLVDIHEEPSANGFDLFATPFDGDQDLQHFLVDLTFSAKVQLRRQISSAQYTPAKVELVRKPPLHAQAYEDFFACPVQFGCLRNKMSPNAGWQDFPLPLANANAFGMAYKLLVAENERFSVLPALGVSVKRAIGNSLPKVPDITQVASILNLSERTLRRKLAYSGLSFRQLLDESRKTKALGLMASGKRGFSEIAAATGFSDPRAFTRAFKRWTGLPPSQFDAAEAAMEAPVPFEVD